MDFDFDFIDSTIKSSAEELSSSLLTCVEEIRTLASESGLIAGAEEFSGQLDSQVAAVSAI